MFQMHLLILFAVISISQVAKGYFYSYSNPPLEEAQRRAAEMAMKATPFEVGFLVRCFLFQKRIFAFFGGTQKLRITENANISLIFWEGSKQLPDLPNTCST